MKDLINIILGRLIEWKYNLWVMLREKLNDEETHSKLIKFAKKAFVGLSILGVLAVIVRYVAQNWEVILLTFFITGAVIYGAVLLFCRIRYMLRTGSVDIETAAHVPLLNELDEAIKTTQKVLLKALYKALQKPQFKKMGLTIPAQESEIRIGAADLSKQPIIFPFHVWKSGGDVDTKQLYTVLGATIDRMAEAGELYGVPRELFYYDGLFYPQIRVTSIDDEGASVCINMLSTDKEGLEAIRARRGNLPKSKGGSYHDIELE